MPSSLILVLAIYPLCSLAVLTAFALRPRGITSGPALPLRLGANEERAAVARIAVFLPLSFYVLLVCCVFLWLHGSPLNSQQIGLRTSGWISSILRGGFVGMAWTGLWLRLWPLLPALQGFRREVPGLGGTRVGQIGVWMCGGFADELWRVACIAALLNAGHSPEFSLATCAAAFASAFSVQGMRRSLLAGIDGVIFGGLFLSRQSLLAPFAAHLTAQAVWLWGVGRYLEEQQFGRVSKNAQPNCPLCGAHVSPFQIKREVFTCPSCHKPLSVSEGYRAAMRWLGLGIGTLLVGFWFIFAGQGLAGFGVWVGMAFFTFGASTSALILIQALFPPRLQYGDPNFIGLSLGDQHPPSSSPPENS
jgi:hypothetical protein